MNSLVSKFFDIQDIITKYDLKIGIQLPEIVVVGSQSAGKSTVLEALIGYNILPKGKGMVTRCPIKVYLHRIKEDVLPYAKCEELLEKGQTSIEEIAKLIEEKNGRLKGESSVSDKPLEIHIYSQKVIDLTLVDTPGIIRITGEGVSENIIEDIQRIARKCASNKNSIILAICAANVDLQLSDGLAIAKQEDPLFERTLGVLTKIDIMARENNFLEIIQNREYRIRLGYYGVKCVSSSKDEKNNDFANIIEEEKRFFNEHPLLGKTEERKNLGIPALLDKLSVILHENILNVIPILEKEILNIYKAKKFRMSEIYGQLKMNNKKKSYENTYQAKAMEIFDQAFIELNNFVTGTSIFLSDDIPQGGFKLRLILSKFNECVETAEEPQVTPEEIQVIWDNTNGLIGHDTFQTKLIEKKLPMYFGKISSTIQQCLEEVDEEYKSIIQTIRFKEFDESPSLKTYFVEEVTSVAFKRKIKTERKLVKIIELCKKYINPDNKEIKVLREDPISLHSAVEILKKYFDIARKGLQYIYPIFIQEYYLKYTFDQAKKNIVHAVANTNVSDRLFKHEKKLQDELEDLMTIKSQYKKLLAKIKEFNV